MNTLRLARGLATAAALSALVLSPLPSQPQAQAASAGKGPLSIAKQSFFYIGGHYDETQPDRHVVGQHAGPCVHHEDHTVRLLDGPARLSRSGSKQRIVGLE